jgi:serine O-acetyltransferase
MAESTFQLLRFLTADLRRQSDLLRGTGTPRGSGLFLDVLSPRFGPVLLCRLAHRLHLWHLGPIAKLFSLLNFVIFGIEIAVRCPIGPGLFIPHSQGIVIGAARIGCNATIYQGVTLGAKDLDFSYLASRRPTVGNNVLIGAGAKVLGGIELGNDVIIGANAVVLDSMPDGVLATGIPARIIRSSTTS